MNKSLATQGMLQDPTRTTPSVVVMEFDDPAKLTEAFDGLIEFSQDIVSLASKPFRALRVIVRLGSSVLVYQRTSHRLRSYTKLKPGPVTFLVTGPQASGSLNGRILGPGILVAASPGAEAEIVADAGYSSVTFMISASEIADRLSNLGRKGEFQVPDGFVFHAPNFPAANRLYDLGQKISYKAEKYQRLFNNIEGVRQSAHVEILDALLSTLATGSGVEPTRRERTKANYSRIVSLVQAYCLENVDDHFGIADICNVANVGERTLQYAFQEIMGTPPMAYLLRVRLHRARADLVAASRLTTTVSAVALNWGFWHFGEFSRAYKLCFQETPSDTLRRKASAPPNTNS